jgi:hypothetical protein
VTLINDNTGAFGNRTISTTARSNTLAVNAMSGGGGYDCATGTGCTQTADCSPGLVCQTNGTCGVP